MKHTAMGREVLYFKTTPLPDVLTQKDLAMIDEVQAQLSAALAQRVERMMDDAVAGDSAASTCAVQQWQPTR